MALHIGLRAKVFGGFGVLVVLGVAMASFGAIGIADVSTSIAAMNSLSGNVIRAMEASRLMEVMLRSDNRYRLDRNPVALASIKDSEQQIAARMADAAAATMSPERKRQYEEIAEMLRGVSAATGGFLAAYDTGFAERALLFTGGDALTAATGKLVAAVPADPDVRAAAARVESAVLLVRVASWRFLATMDPGGVATFKTNESKAMAELAALEKQMQQDPAMQPALALLPPVREALEAYRDHFEKASSALLDGARRFSDDMLPKLRAMQDATAARVAELKSDFAAASQTAASNADGTIRLQWIVALAGAAGGLVMAVLIARGIVGPIAGMTRIMARLAKGEHQIDVPGRDNADEVGEMARAVEVFRLNAIEAERVAAEKSADQAVRDRRHAALSERTAAFGTSVSGVMASLVAAADTMRASAREMADAAARTTASTSEAVDGAKASSRDLNSVAVAAEEMASSISEISKQVGHVTSAVQDAVSRATTTDRKVAGLAEAADRIGDVIRLISDIAGQTNLLALNATIEAARAGEAGKGFAVVAGEVKALAAATARATDQIGTQIVAIREATGEAVQAVRDVGTAIGQVSSVASAIAAAVEEQAAATQEISSSVQTVTMATGNAALSMERVLGIAEHNGATSRNVQTVADTVGATAETLRTEVAGFIAAVAHNDDDDRADGRAAGAGTQASRRA